jgi:hypothetical protein
LVLWFPWTWPGKPRHRCVSWALTSQSHRTTAAS